MKNYREQSGCWSCKHCIEYLEYAGIYWYCNIDKSLPKWIKMKTKGKVHFSTNTYGGLLDKLKFTAKEEELFEKRRDIWYKWIQSHQVCTHGICESYREV